MQRDVLKKWREESTAGPWWVSEPLSEDLSAELAYDLGVVGGGDETLATVHGPSADARLIVGTAGNPDLLDALDGLLESWTDWSYSIPPSVESVADAIIFADERMNS